MLCIRCPKGCPLDSPQCKLGEAFALQERTNPVRSVTSTVKTVFPDFKRVPVRTASPVPRGKVFEVCKLLHGVTLDKRLSIGEIVLENVLELGVDVIVTADMTEEGGPYEEIE